MALNTTIFMAKKQDPICVCKRQGVDNAWDDPEPRESFDELLGPDGLASNRGVDVGREPTNTPGDDSDTTDDHPWGSAFDP